MYEKSAISQLAILSVLSVLLLLSSTEAFAQQAESKAGGPVYHISALKSDFEKNTLSISILGETVPAYTVSERFAPFRVIVDVAGAVFDDTADQKALLPDNPVGNMKISRLSGQQPDITRFEIAIADTHDYKVKRNGNNIDIVVAPASDLAAGNSAIAIPENSSITDFQVTSAPGETSILLTATAPVPAYRVATLDGSDGRPARMYIDVDNVSITELVREKKIGTSVDKIRVAPRGTGARIVFDSSSQQLFDYDVKITSEGLEVVINEKIQPLPEQNLLKRVAAPKSGTVADSTLDELIESSSSLLSKTQAGEQDATQDDPLTALQDSFAFSGYKNQRISVDFYKIDIHNVFRLFRQITDLNIIVDEDVSGTLTLALSDVPWDFALDIILNLKDLEKEERFNTIVIYPKKKEFVWPERAEDNLAFEADIEVVEQEALIIQQSSTQTPEIMKAKEILRSAKIAEKKENFEYAAELYEQAAELWPTNANLYNRLSTLYLVHLGMNAKAVFFAKKALKVDPANDRAALYAAIGSANMQRIADASEYFTQAVSNEPPMKEALFSFASFSESNKQNIAALKLLDKYHQYYGETVDTMLAKARIYDKIGETDKATAQYRAIMSSGYQLRPDLKKYISGRLAAGNI